MAILNYDHDEKEGRWLAQSNDRAHWVRANTPLDAAMGLLDEIGGALYAAEESLRQVKRAAAELRPVGDVDALAAIIRKIDGGHALGAGELAELLVAKGVRVT